MVYSAYSLYKNVCHYFALEVKRHLSPKRILTVDLAHRINDQLSTMALISFCPVKGAVLNREGHGTYKLF